MQAEHLQELSNATVQHEKKCWPWSGHHTISDLIFTEGNLYCELTIVHCSGFIVLKEPEGQVARWLEGMAELNYEVVHRPGKQHALYADALSRGQCRQCGLDFSCTEFEEEEVVMMAAEVSILPVWSNQDIRNLQKADTNLRTAMEWESQASLHSNVHKIQPGSSNPRGVI